MTEDDIGRCIVNIAVQIHRALGCDLLETVYEVILTQELRDRGLTEGFLGVLATPVAWLARGNIFLPYPHYC